MAGYKTQFAPLAGMTLEQINAEYKRAFEVECEYKQAAHEAQVFIREEKRAEIIASYRASAKLAFQRQMECHAAYHALRATLAANA